MNGSNERVLHVLGSLNTGGKEICAMNFYRHINKDNIQFDFAIFQDEKNHYDYNYVTYTRK